MAAPTKLNALDAPIVEQTQFGPDMQRWLSNIVDIINANFALLGRLIAVQGIDIGGSGAGPINVSVVGLVPTGSVDVTLISSSNPVTILTVTPGTNQFAITFSGDPGASAIIVYSAFAAQPQ